MPQVRFFQALLFLVLGVILIITTDPAPPAATADVNDKLAHALSFLMLGLLAQQAFPRLRTDWSLYTWLLVYGLGIELIQFFIPERSFSLLDLAADAAGLLMAYAFMLSIRQVKRAC